MHFENVQLPVQVIAELYKQSLVVLQDVQPNITNGDTKTVIVPDLKIETGEIHAKKSISNPPVSPIDTVIQNENNNIPYARESEVPAFKYLGGYQKQVAIVLIEHFNPHISEEDLEFLSKLLTACKLSLNDVAIINAVNNPQISELWQTLQPKVMMLFDVDPGAVGLPFRRPHFEVQQWSGSSFLNAPELEKFRLGNEQDVKALKTRLWNCLKQIFLGG